MKKTIFIILISIQFASICYAQGQQKKFHIGPRIGFSICDIKTEGSWDEEDIYYGFYTNLLFFLNAGVMVDYNCAAALENYSFSIQITPHYNGKGCWLLGESNSYSGVEEKVVKMHYFDVPIQVVGKYGISKRQSIVFGLGPTFNIGISHSHKRPKEHFQFGNGEGRNGLHRLDIGAVASIGIESYKGLRFDLNYFIPIKNLSINKSKSFQFFQTGITIGYFF